MPRFDYPLQVHEQTSQATQRSAHLQEDEFTITTHMKQILIIFFFPGSVVADLAAEMSNKTVWFIKVVSKVFSGENDVNDDYKNIILPHTAYSTGNFLEHVCYKKTN